MSGCVILTTNIKKEIRILGIDDSSLLFDPVLVVGAFFRGNSWLDGVMRCYVKKDGTDATDNIAQMVLLSKHRSQIKVILLDGITFAGFNIVDIDSLYEMTGIPVIVVMRSMPDIDLIRKALENLDDGIYRYSLILRAGDIKKVNGPKGSVYVQFRGIDSAAVEKIVEMTSTRSIVPEPLRVAHMIATGIVCGESRGRA